MLLKKDVQGDKTLRVAFPSNTSASAFEPTKISLDYEYIFLENIFSPLVEVDNKGGIQPGVAEHVEWVGDELRFDIRRDLKTASGKVISASDVVFSLKRLLVLSGNTHGNFKDLVCAGASLKSVNDECPGIRKEGNSVFLLAKERKSFLLPMLTSIDFAVIPEDSVDPTTLVLINYKETSGPYYVSQDDGKGHVELTLNRSHYHAAEGVAAKVVLVPTYFNGKSESLQALMERRVDHITTVDSARAEEILKFADGKESDFNVHATMKIRSILMAFTERGMKELSEPERRNIGKKMRFAMQEIYKDVQGTEEREEFFPSLSDGALTDEQHQKITEINAQPSEGPHGKIRIGFIKRGSLTAWETEVHKVLPNVECYIESNVPDLKYKKMDEMPLAFVTSSDVGAMEDITLISYSLNAGLLGLSKPQREQWLADYMATAEKKDRMTKLRALHFDALSTAVTIPLLASPYVAIARKPWRIELSDLYANNQLWQIKNR